VLRHSLYCIEIKEKNDEVGLMKEAQNGGLPALTAFAMSSSIVSVVHTS
jgi:hypothetical protein